MEKLLHDDLDASGLPLKLGDQVWRTDTCEPCHVVKPDDGKGLAIIDNDKTGWRGQIDHKKLTHQEPDSIKKICEEMKRENVGVTFEPRIDEWANRLTAIMERDQR